MFVSPGQPPSAECTALLGSPSPSIWPPDAVIDIWASGIPHFALGSGRVDPSLPSFRGIPYQEERSSVGRRGQEEGKGTVPRQEPASRSLDS